MQLTVRQVATKPEWLAKISAFLHDAGLSDPFTYDRATHTFRLPLGRIGYEFRQKRSALGFLTVWAMPFVPAILTVEHADLDLTEEQPGAPEDIDQLIAIEMPDPTLLELWARGDREGVIRLRCTADTSLTIADTGPAEARLAIRSFFTLIIPEQIIKDIVNTSVA